MARRHAPPRWACPRSGHRLGASRHARANRRSAPQPSVGRSVSISSKESRNRSDGIRSRSRKIRSEQSQATASEQGARVFYWPHGGTGAGRCGNRGRKRGIKPAPDRHLDPLIPALESSESDLLTARLPEGATRVDLPGGPSPEGLGGHRIQLWSCPSGDLKSERVDGQRESDHVRVLPQSSQRVRSP
jgi:hypothetical protein